MCGLNAVFCTVLQRAVMADGSTADLLNADGCHHPFVMACSPVFPEKSMRYLVDQGLTTEDEYRALAIGERIRTLVSSGLGATGPFSSFIYGKADMPERDLYVSAPLWERITRDLPRLRAQRTLDSIFSSSWSGLLQQLHAADANPMVCEWMEKGELRIPLPRNDGMPIAYNGVSTITVGIGAVSRAYATSLVSERARELAGQIESRHTRVDVLPEAHILWALFPSEVKAYDDACASFPSGDGRKKKRRYRQQTIEPSAKMLGSTIRSNRQKIIDVIFAERVVMEAPEPVALAA